MASPFQVGGPVVGEYFTGRESEVEEIYRAMRAPTRTLVRGGRRQGKTSAIVQAARRFRSGGGVVLWVDMETLARLSDVRDRLLSSVPPGFFGTFEGLQRLRSVLEVVLDPATGQQRYRFRVESRRSGDHGVREQIRVLITSLDRRVAATGRTVAIVLDGIQAIMELRVSEGAGFFRDLMQSTSHLSFVCAGSESLALRAMVEDQHGAFFHFFSSGPVIETVEKNHLGSWIASRLAGAGIECPMSEGHAIAEVGDRTQDIILYADAVYTTALAQRRVDPEVRADALVTLVREGSAHFGRIWSGLTPNQRLVVRAIATGVRELYAYDRALPLAASSVQRAAEALRKKGVLEEVPGPERFEIPFFHEWVLRYAMADSVPPGLTGGAG